MYGWEEKLRCPHCKKEHSYDVLEEVQGTEGVMSFPCVYCGKYFEVDYSPTIEFQMRELDIDD